MTTLTLTPENPGQPRTHAFVIGVGAYRHLIGGSKPHRNDPLYPLRQLSSPPVSARHFADWLLKDFHHPTAELGTVELLLSEHLPSPAELDSGASVTVEYSSPKGQATWQIEAATIDNLKAAYKRWRDACNEDPRNVAIFYYCGHGVLLQGEHVLLAEDYGSDPDLPFDGAFNFDALRFGMEACCAGLQSFFVDACSNVSIDSLELRHAGVRVFQTTNWTPATPYPRGLALDATAPGDSAYGDTGQVARFTDALVRCLNGLAAKPKRNAPWTVYSNSLKSAVEEVMDFLQTIRPGPSQTPSSSWYSGNGILHECDQPPLVPVVVQLTPDEAALGADLTLGAPGDPVPRWQCAPGTGNGPNGVGWVIDGVPAGTYALRADFPKGQFKAHTVEVLIEPPGPHPDPYPITCEAIT